MILNRRAFTYLLLASALLVDTACGEERRPEGSTSANVRIVATTALVADVVERIGGDAVSVESLMPRNVDPHDFELSARQASELRKADGAVAIGAGFESSLGDALDGAVRDGLDLLELADHVDLLPAGAEQSHEEDGHEDEGHEEEGHEEEGHEEAGHGHQGSDSADDPHFFTDPIRMQEAATAIGRFVADLVPDRASEVKSSAAAFRDELGRLHAELQQTLDTVPAGRRLLVTNHDTFTYFAERYDLQILGTVLASTGTAGQASGRDVAELAALMRERGVKAIFTDSSSPSGTAAALAAEAGAKVIELPTESLGAPGSGAATYSEMLRTIARRIAAALS